MVNIARFSGTFKQQDISYLLQPLEMSFTDVALKEKLIQNGEKHYSDMLSEESPPSAEQLSVFHGATKELSIRLKSEIQGLAQCIVEKVSARPIVLASLVRAGAPLGVLLYRAITRLGVPCEHYGISIIRDRGMDNNALSYIESQHGTEGIVFVDGWVGKGAILTQLREALKGREGYPLEPRLVVLADPCKIAWLSASDEDWLIPFGILGAPVAGLISRSVYQKEGYHGCVVYSDLSQCDQTSWFINTVDSAEVDDGMTYGAKQWHCCSIRSKQCEGVVNWVMSEFDVTKKNYVKPGIAEATRAVMRRVPELVLVSDKKDKNLEVLMSLCEKRGVKVIEVGDKISPYFAITVIKKVG